MYSESIFFIPAFNMFVKLEIERESYRYGFRL